MRGWRGRGARLRRCAALRASPATRIGRPCDGCRRARDAALDAVLRPAAGPAHAAPDATVPPGRDRRDDTAVVRVLPDRIAVVALLARHQGRFARARVRRRVAVRAAAQGTRCARPV